MKLRISLISTVFFLIFCWMNTLTGQSIERVEPPNWWTGMKNTELQLMVRGKDIAQLNPRINYPGVELYQVRKVSNPNYLFLDLRLSRACQPGTFSIDFLNGTKVESSYNYSLAAREKGSAMRAGFDNSDVMYLITPDRFVNGKPKNDNVKGMKEKANRDFKGGRHGGDIKGLSKSLKYISEMGFTAIWLNPLLENDMEEYSYHGYSTTDYYKVDPRYGDNEEYRKLISDANKMGIKFIMDMIANHCGLFHWWMDDLPTKDWINQWPEFTGTNHRKTLIQDPYASELDKRILTDAWFVPTMPDMNQKNKLVATYLIQNTIWWIEYSGISGIRMDTYPYADMDYMADWTVAVMNEYPNFSIVGEEWYGDPSVVSYWQKDKINPNGYTSELGSLMDFPLQEALVKSLNEKEEWGKGLITLYEALAKDFAYSDPMSLVTFPDNHDMSRIFQQLNKNYDHYKMALAYILTIRGIPQIYYGTEILMTDDGDHGVIRSDFPGGWKGDTVNAFTGKGLTEQQKQAQEYLKSLLLWRQGSSAVHTGKLVHFLPENGTYTYFRFNDSETVMVILNKNEQSVSLELDRFAEVITGKRSAKDALTGQAYDLSRSTIDVPAKTSLILEVF